MDAAVAKCSEYRPLFAVPILQSERGLMYDRGTPHQQHDSCVACLAVLRMAQQQSETATKAVSREASRSTLSKQDHCVSFNSSRNGAAPCITTSHSCIRPRMCESAHLNSSVALASSEAA